MSKSKIEWLRGSDGVEGKTWNPVTGCTKISTGCQKCYAERMSKRLAGRFGYPADEPFRVTLHPDKIDKPLHWKKPRMVFVCSMGDLFHEDVPDEFIYRCFLIKSQATHHTYQVLTKRPERMCELMERAFRPGQYSGPAANVWLGTSVENQETADERIPHLLDTPAAVRFLSLEPLLGPVDLTAVVRVLPVPQTEVDVSYVHGTVLGTDGHSFSPCGATGRGIDWVIVGGESGPGARPMDPDWVRSIRDQCVAAGVPFFFKGWGGINKKKSGRKLESRTWDEMPTNRSTI